MRLRRSCLALVALLSFVALVRPAAAAPPSVKVTMEQTGFQGRLVVTVSSSRAFTARTRPRAVTVRYKRASYRLRRARTARAAARATSTWRTSARAQFLRLLGKRVSVVVRTAAGSARFLRVVRRPPPLFQPPPRDLTGDAAIARVLPYLVNSRFTDCAKGFPACSSERRFDHCAGGGPTGRFQSRYFPADVTVPTGNGAYRVVSASFSTSGAWSVSYEVTLDSGKKGAYSWSVQPDGSAQGAYGFEEQVGLLRGLRWQRPSGC